MCYIDFGVPDSKAASPELNQFMLEFEKGRLCGMTCECVIALVTCVATIITTVIAVLSYLHARKS